MVNKKMATLSLFFFVVVFPASAVISQGREIFVGLSAVKNFANIGARV